jgi:hypothetical protein
MATPASLAATLTLRAVVPYLLVKSILAETLMLTSGHPVANQ